MTDLRTAAQQALEFIRTMNQQGWMLADYEDDMERTVAGLEAALAEPVVNQQLATEQAEPDSPERRCGGPGCDGTCCQPVQEPVEPVAWADKRTLDRIKDFDGTIYANGGFDYAVPLYTAPPQRKPLAEWQINDLMSDIDPEDRDSWSFRQGVYAAEKHHGVKP